MKNVLALVVWLSIFGVVGCRQPDPPPASGVNVRAPFVNVTTGDRGVSVDAPGAVVRVP